MKKHRKKPLVLVERTEDSFKEALAAVSTFPWRPLVFKETKTNAKPKI